MFKILIIGDLHQDFKPIKNLYEYFEITKTPLTKNDTLICLGDFSANFFFNHRDINFKKKLSKYNIQYFVVRGNHEERPTNCIKKDPNDWHTEIFWGNTVYVENDYPYIKYALDYPAKYEIPIEENKVLKTLVLPGAYSVDKYYRPTNNLTWFPDEQCTKDERDFGITLAKLYNWDLVLSHTSPAIYEPTDLYSSSVDEITVDRTTEWWLGSIEYNLNYKLWAFGHFHSNRVYPKYQDKQVLMLYNNYFFDVKKYFYETDIYKCFITFK